MRYHIWTIVVILMALTIGCKDGPADAAPTSVSPITTSPMTSTAPAGGVEHYTCPNGHAGSGGPAAGSCSNCGAVLEHNQAFHDNDAPAPAADPISTTTTQVANTTGVEHYTCPNGHVGSGGEGEGSCSNCGAALEHNQAYHANDVQNQTINPINAGAAAPVNVNGGQPITPQPGGAVSPVFQNVNSGGANFTNTAAPAPTAYEPPQNSLGVWHYTCTNGCAGGAGGASACSSCGSTLVHNQTYHN